MQLLDASRRQLSSVVGAVAGATLELGAMGARRLPFANNRSEPGRTARVVRTMAAPRSAVYAVLADPATYEHWVVGAHEVDAFEPEWPAPSATFRHRQGLPFLNIEDTTSVLENEPEHRLVLEVRARPLVVARVEFLLVEHGAEETTVTMLETPIDGAVHALENPLVTHAIRLRNAETLRRLEQIARG